MCTVTLFPTSDNDFVLTSNRDEAPNRISLEPDFYNIENTTLLFPKDKVAGGTWIGVSEKNRVICLLNGGFKIHKRQPKYRVSRGVVTKDLLITDNIERCIENYNFDDIEPFTVVVADWNSKLKFYELVCKQYDPFSEGGDSPLGQQAPPADPKTTEIKPEPAVSTSEVAAQQTVVAPPPETKEIKIIGSYFNLNENIISPSSIVINRVVFNKIGCFYETINYGEEQDF